MTQQLLNQNQRRRLSTNLVLLENDLGALSRLPELGRTGSSYARVRELVAGILQKAATTRATLDLGDANLPSLRRRIAAVAEIWAVRVEDLVARRLQGYGAVHPDLARQLDPPIRELAAMLEQLADAAAALPEG
jgi:hypothetical protein